MKAFEEKGTAFKKSHPQFEAEEPFFDWGVVIFGVIGWLIFPVIGTILGVMEWQAIHCKST